MELSIVQEVLGVEFGKVTKDAEGKLEELYREYLIEYISRVSLERKALEIVNELRLEVTEMEGLKQELLLPEMSMKEKEKCVSELSATLLKQGEQLELASQELNNLRCYASQQQTIISESNKELDLLKSQLEEALEQNEVHNVEIDKLNQKLEQAMEELKEANQQKKVILTLTQEKQSILLLVEVKEKEHKKQMETVNVLVHGLSKMISDFECLVAEDIRKNNIRLEHLNPQSSSLIQQACLQSDMDELVSQMPESSMQSSSAVDEVFTQVMGPEQPGRVRTYGFGPSPRDVSGHKKSEEMQAMQSQLDEQLSRHKAEMEAKQLEMKTQQAQIKKQMSQMEAKFEAQQRQFEVFLVQMRAMGMSIPEPVHKNTDPLQVEKVHRQKRAKLQHINNNAAKFPSNAHGLGTAALSAKELEALPFCAIAYALTGIFGTLICSDPAVRQSLLAEFTALYGFVESSC
ncbi:unnamed protein product [Ilex paraguariensis]|uniref:Uncharacterized protein n=1 Tax=Ilex paraguariensis TaxID=185542 RepID=A0ABC8R849_9AQUA